MHDAPKDLSEKLFTFYLEHGIESDDAFEEDPKQEYKAVDYRVLAAAVNAYLKEKYLHLKAYPGVADTLRGVKAAGIQAWRRERWIQAEGVDAVKRGGSR